MMSILSSITISQDRSRIMFIESVELDVLRNLVPPSGKFSVLWGNLVILTEFTNYYI